MKTQKEVKLKTGESLPKGMNTQHTPGPWKADGTHIRYQRNPGGYRFDIAEAFRDVGAEQASANARLIAAAPELLAACERAKYLAACLRDTDLRYSDAGPELAEIIEVTKAAIAKAKGGTV